jgi:signal transduction histidine kinase
MDQEAHISLLTKHLDEALLQLKWMEEDNMRLRAFIHDIASPLQILGMSIESMLDHSSSDQRASLERMKRSTDKMLAIILEFRKLQKSLDNRKKMTVNS